MKKLLHPGNIILAGFSAMVLFMCYLVFQCQHHPSVMVSKNYYEQEMKYQEVIEAEKNAQALSETIRLEKKEEDLVLRFPQAVNQDLKNAEIVLYNKADDTKDQHIRFDKREDGLYSIPLTKQMRGNYDIKVSLKTSTKSYYQEFPVIL